MEPAMTAKAAAVKLECHWSVPNAIGATADFVATPPDRDGKSVGSGEAVAVAGAVSKL